MPFEHLNSVKEALFSVGAGRIGRYDKCCFETRGTGQFRPLEGSSAFLGEVGKVEKVDEVKVEMVCENSIVLRAIEKLKESHPYETPAYEVYTLEDY